MKSKPDHQQQIDAIIAAGTAENTLRAHKGDARYFWAWAAAAMDLEPLYPIPERIIIQFITEHLTGLDPAVEHELMAARIKAKKGPHSVATIARRVATLSFMHESQKLPNPCRNQEVRLLLSKAKKAASKNGRRPGKKRALVWKDLKAILRTFNNSIKDKRDRAILLFAFASGGRRRSEVSGARYEHLQRIRGGYLYELHRSKTDQEGRGAMKPILKSAAKALTKWLKASNIADGYLFRRILDNGTISSKPILPETVNQIVKLRVEMIGLNPDQYGAHSLRSGFMTESGLRKEPLGEAMQLSGHKTAQVALGYYQAGDILRNPTGRMID